MSSRSPSQKASRSPAPEITIGGACRTYRTRGFGDRPAITNIDLTVPAGGFTAIIGASGCGKSTLLRLVGGLDQADAGVLSIGDQAPRLVRAEGAIGFVPQSPALLPWRSVADNVALLDQIGPWKPKRVGPEAVQGWLDRVGLSEDQGLLPHELSGGMQQRVALARAFALAPSVLLMDEPFNALDEVTRDQMHDLVASLYREWQPTVLFVTHSIDEAVKLADEVIVMAGAPGTIVARRPIDLARPRSTGIEDTAAFREHTSALRSVLLEGSTS